MICVIVDCNRQSKILYISIRISDRGYTSSIQKARTSPIFIVSRVAINNTVCHALGKYLFVHTQSNVFIEIDKFIGPWLIRQKFIFE